MQPVRHIEDLEEAIARVRHHSHVVSTNFFAGREQLEAWKSRQGLCFTADDTCILLLKPDGDFCRVYHIAASLESLTDQLQELTTIDRTFVVDLIGPSQALSTTAQAYAVNGFEPYHSLLRMSAATGTLPTRSAPDDAVEFATAHDAPQISAFLGRMLDPYVDQIPCEFDLRAAAARQNVLVTRAAGQISAALVFEKTGLSAHLRYWYVAPESRGRGSGARLIKTFFRICSDARRVVLWVVADNEDSIARYQHYGFRSEELRDQIMLRRAA